MHSCKHSFLGSSVCICIWKLCVAVKEPVVELLQLLPALVGVFYCSSVTVAQCLTPSVYCLF
jgi:hypothetical protein